MSEEQEISEDWPFPEDVSCPECDEFHSISAKVEIEDGEPVITGESTTMKCFTCNHTWEHEHE